MSTPTRPYVKDGIEFDQIAVRGIRVTGSHGVFAVEREDGQLFLADVVAHVNTRAAAVGDDLTRTVNYSDIADRTAEILAGSPFKLIEAVAEHVARELLEFDLIECVDITIHKPQAPLHVEFKDVTVTIRRDLRDASLSADKRIGSSAGFSDDPLASAQGPRRDRMDERPAQPVGAVIALGGNLGDVEPTFRDALAALHRVNGIEMRAASPLFKTEPEGGADQPQYLNAVARIHTMLSPRELLAACHGIEVLHGRDRTVPGAARTLDLDILSYDGVTGESADLTLPHPRAHQRPFVLLPWSHMEPDAVLEPHGRVADLLQRAGTEGVTMVAPRWPHVPAPDALGGSSAPVAASSAPAGQAADAGEAGQSAQTAQSAQPAQSAHSPETGQLSQAEQQSGLQQTPTGPLDEVDEYPAESPSSQDQTWQTAPSVDEYSAQSPADYSAPSAASAPRGQAVWHPVLDEAQQPSESSVSTFHPARAHEEAAPAEAAPQQAPPTEAAPSEPQPAHRPDAQQGEGQGAEGDAAQPQTPQPGVPRRTSFGVLRRSAAREDGPGAGSQ